MCFSAFPELEALYKEINEVVSSLEFMFWINGITLPIILCAGFVLNIVCLVVICLHGRRTPDGSSPHRLLLSLIVCDLLIMAFSVYSDVEPAIRAKVDIRTIHDTLNIPDCQTIADLRARLESLKAGNSSVSGSGVGLFDFDIGSLSSNGSIKDVSIKPETTDRERRNSSNRGIESDKTEDDLMLLLLYTLLTEKNDIAPVSKLTTDSHARNTSTQGSPNADHEKSQYTNRNGIGSYARNIHDTLWNTTIKPTTIPLVTTQSLSSINISNTNIVRSVPHPTVTSSSIAPDSPLQNITINSRPFLQAAERLVAYSLMTFNLGLTLTLTLERCLAVRFPFRVVTLLTPGRTYLAVLTLAGGTLMLHTPQFLREVVMAIREPGSLKDDFQGNMLQSYRRPYELTVVCTTSGVLILTLVLSGVLLYTLSAYTSKVKHNKQHGNAARVDVNVTITVLVLVLLQTPQAVAMIVLTCMSLNDLVTHTSTFTRAVTIVRLLYLSNSALAHGLVYCVLARDFRRKLSRHCCSATRCRCCHHTSWSSGPGETGGRMAAVGQRETVSTT